MTPFQIFLIVALGLATTVILHAMITHRIGRFAGMVVILILIAGIMASISPNQTTSIAKAIGISRGTDLLLYIMVLAVLQGFLLVYLRLRRVRRELTILVRKLALLEAHDPGASSNRIGHDESPNH